VNRTHVELDRRDGSVRSERRRELVCVREYFPSTLRAAVRQKARWVVGIALQGWRTWGWRGDWTGRYLLMRDRKVLVMSLVAMAAYLVFVMTAVHGVWQWLATGSAAVPALGHPGSWLPILLVANLLLLGLRALQRALCTGLLYGPLEAVLSIPRMVWASVINILATLRALRLWQEHLLTGKPIGWDKTVHQFPEAMLQPTMAVGAKPIPSPVTEASPPEAITTRLAGVGTGYHSRRDRPSPGDGAPPRSSTNDGVQR